MVGHYDPTRVLLSLLLSLVSAWAALELAGRLAAERGRSRHALWLSCGAFSMGVGIWSMHYVGMLAYVMEMPVLYDWPTVLVSMLAGVCASGLALHIVSRRTLSWPGTFLGSLFMGGGIASMHYIGMAAMRMPMGLHYSGFWVGASVAAAVLISMVALRLTFGTKNISSVLDARKLGSALLMGIAIPTMHYLGMAAARWTAEGGRFHPDELRHAIPISNLSTMAIVAVSLLVLAIALASVAVDRNLRAYEQTLDGSEQHNAFLTTHQTRMQSAFRASGVGIWECDPATELFYVDPHLHTMYGLPQDNAPVPRELWKARVHPDDVEALDRKWYGALAEHEKYDNQYRVLCADGSFRHYRSAATISRDQQGTVDRVYGMTWDVTAEHDREQAIADQAERFHMTLEAIGDGVITVDGQRRIVYMNPVASALTGWTSEESIGKPLADVFITRDEETDLVRRDPVQRCIEAGGKLLAEDGILISRCGERHNIKKQVALTDRGIAAVLTFQDITETRRLDRKLQYAALHDGLTGMLNRTAFGNKLNALWQENRTSARVHTLCVLDLDRFKVINDTSGHMAGDKLLEEVGRVLEAKVRHTDVVARMGADEFLLLLVDTAAEEAEQTAGRLLSAVSEIGFCWQGRTYDVTASIGLVTLDSTSPTPENLLSQADVAVFSSKQNGRNRASVYHHRDGHTVTEHQQMEAATNLRQVIEAGRLELYAQAIQEAATSECTCYYELLLRMRDEQGGLVAPALFIPAAERYGMMPLVDRWVLRNAFQTCAQICGSDPRMRFAINISADSLSDPGLWPFVQELFSATGLAPANITFEITETGFIQNISHANEFVLSAQNHGCKIALDDFGTGLSSLSYLKQFPLDVLKIDGSFIKNLATNPIDQSIVRAVAEMATALGLVTVAECVEDEYTLDVIRQLGIEFAQGWAIGKPGPLSSILTRVQADSPLGNTPSHTGSIEPAGYPAQLA
jgi:diguanylate cyclase (GGDEF)-like protein/PAS domain S-box-containing protein